MHPGTPYIAREETFESFFQSMFGCEPELYLTIVRSTLITYFPSRIHGSGTSISSPNNVLPLVHRTSCDVFYWAVLLPHTHFNTPIHPLTCPPVWQSKPRYLAVNIAQFMATSNYIIALFIYLVLCCLRLTTHPQNKSTIEQVPIVRSPQKKSQQ